MLISHNISFNIILWLYFFDLIQFRGQGSNLFAKKNTFLGQFGFTYCGYQLISHYCQMFCSLSHYWSEFSVHWYRLTSSLFCAVDQCLHRPYKSIISELLPGNFSETGSRERKYIFTYLLRLSIDIPLLSNVLFIVTLLE